MNFLFKKKDFFIFKSFKIDPAKKTTFSTRKKAEHTTSFTYFSMSTDNVFPVKKHVYSMKVMTLQYAIEQWKLSLVNKASDQFDMNNYPDLVERKEVTGRALVYKVPFSDFDGTPDTAPSLKVGSDSYNLYDVLISERYNDYCIIISTNPSYKIRPFVCKILKFVGSPFCIGNYMVRRYLYHTYNMKIITSKISFTLTGDDFDE